MYKRDILSEGLRAGDLKDIVLPLISVDEYQSKIAPDADPKSPIVIGLYIHDKTAATDLNRFIQRSHLPLLDTDVSPAPDQHGNYMVFVEMLMNERFADDLDTLLKDLEPLTGIDQWQMRIRKQNSVSDFAKDKLINGIRAARETIPTKVVEMLQKTSPCNVSTVEDTISFNSGDTISKFFYKGPFVGPFPSSLSYIGEGFSTLDVRQTLKENAIAKLLGKSWNVRYRSGDYLCQFLPSSEVFILKIAS